uniref:Arm DNA-binding domain-containing protein n=1 Tax=Sphingomonas sp. TaxID=28214 RepID=UPI0025D5DA0E|nr:Arm DNA-binding domain-containing protein [Sphingomonas sp.]
MLSENKAKAAKSRQKAYKLSDSARLNLFITPSGGNLWRWNYVYDGKQKSMAFGPFPRVSLAEAREKRDAAHKLVSEG